MENASQPTRDRPKLDCAANTPLAVQASPRRGGRRGGLLPGSILIVDDEVALCEALRDQLRGAGYSIETATGAFEAAERLRSRRFDLILCDVLMPGRSGLELVREALAEDSSLGAMMMSGLDDPDVAESAVGLGAYGYLVKPFTPHELEMQVRNALRRLSLEREAKKRSRALEERRELLERLLRIQRSISHRASLEAVLDAVAEGAHELLGGAGVALHMVDAFGGCEAMAVRAMAPELVRALAPRSGSGNVATRALAERRLVVEREMAAPIHEAGVPTGTLLVTRPSDSTPFSETEQEMLEAFAAHASVALTDAGTMRQLREREALLDKLNVIQRSISRRAPLAEILDAIASGARQLLGDELVTLALVDEKSKRLRIVASRGQSGEALAHRSEPAEMCARAVAEGRLHVHAANGGPPAIAAPIRERGEVVGALAVGSTAPRRRYSSAEQEALVAMAENAGLALTDARSQELVHEAFHDELTGLANRARFLDALKDARGRRVAVVLADLDDFRQISEHLGPAVADAALVATARRLLDCTPEGSVVARLDGDEFGLLVDAGSLNDAEALADRVITQMDAPFRLFGHELSLSLSAGVVHADPGSADLVRDASVSLYRAKRRGKGRWEVFTAAMRRALLTQFELESDLEGAVERGEIRAVYQPVVELHRGRIVGFEALARWEHPRRGAVPPLEFIPIAEGLGIAGAIGEHVLRLALGQVARWRTARRGGESPWVSVNYSPSELESDRFVGSVAAALERAGIPPELLVIELTEAVLVGDIDVARARLDGVRALGARVAIDDFGTGHSSPDYLRRLPFDILKIAREFCDGVDRSPEEAALVRTQIDVARRFELEVIAEGIERPEQQAALIQMGCRLGQGYHFARPLEVEAVDLFMNRRLG